jgi:hypothetical protein
VTEIARTLTAPLHARLPVSVTARVATLASLFSVMFLLGLGFSVSQLNRVDEAWFVQVIARMRAGDVLYRDIAYGAGPLPAYLTEALTYILGVDVLSEKLVTVFAFAASATLAWVVAERLGLGLKGRLFVLGGIAYFSPPLQLPAYGPLATTFVVAALLAALVCRASGQPRTRLLASVAGGAACGFAFVCKQNVGVYALLAFVGVLLVDRRLRNAVVAAASFAGSTGVVLVPVLLWGGFGRYVDYGFTGKGEYVHLRAGPVGAFGDLLETIEKTDSSATAQAAYWAGRLTLPCFAALALVALLPAVRKRRSPVVLPLLLFAAAAGATLYPRFDATHTAYVGAPLVLLIAYALNVSSARVPRAAWLVVALWLGFAIVSMATLPIRLMRSPNAQLSELPHLHGAFVNPAYESRWRREAAQLAVAAAGDPDGLLLLVPDAGFRYLTAGLENPTPFDYPFVTTFGRNGQARVISLLRAGAIRRVCVTAAWSGAEPRQLVGYVRSTMVRGRRLLTCTLYERAG